MHTKRTLFKTLGVFMALAMLLALLPASSAMAQSPYEVGDGDSFANALAGCDEGETIIINGGVHTADISAIEAAKCDIEVEAGELRLTGLETDFNDQGANPAFATLSTYVSREAAGTVTALVPGEVDGTAKWLNVLSSAAGILNNIEGDDGNVQVRFPGTGAAFAGVDMDLGGGFNTLRYNGANMDDAGSIVNVQRLISAVSSTGSFVNVINYDMSNIGEKLDC